MMATPLQMLDAHVHLQDRRFEGQVEAVIQRAEDAGVRLMFCNGTAEEDWDTVLQISDHNKSVMPYVGVHPWESHRVTGNWQSRLQRICAKIPCGVGEIGLDKPCGIPLPIQADLFTGQLEVAVKYSRPIAIHCVKYWGKCLEILEELFAPSLPVPIMIHSFSGSFETMKRLVRLGCHLSFSARMAEPDQLKLRAIFQTTPIENVLLETDAPDQLYGLLNQQDGNQIEFNEPERIILLYNFAAKLLNIKVDRLAMQIWENGLAYQTSDR